jgi:predicted permease
MLDIGFALNAILPMIIIIAVGYVLKQIGIINEEIARGLNRLVFVLLIPVFMFYSIYNMEAFHIDWNLSVFLIVMILMLYVIGWLVAKFFIVDHQSKAVIIQSAIRSNASSVGVPVVLAIALSGLRAEANVIAMTGLTVAIYNTLGVITFQIYDKDTHHIQIFPVLWKVLRNPIIIGILGGFIALLMRPLVGHMWIKDHIPALYDAVGGVAITAAPLSLIALGSTLEFKAMNSMKREFIIGTLLRSVVTPLIVFSIAILFRESLHFDSNHFPALLVVIVPGLAVTVPPMAQHMKSNYKLASQLVVWTALSSTITMFFLIGLLHSLGLL